MAHHGSLSRRVRRPTRDPPLRGDTLVRRRVVAGLGRAREHLSLLSEDKCSLAGAGRLARGPINPPLRGETLARRRVAAGPDRARVNTYPC